MFYVLEYKTSSFLQNESARKVKYVWPESGTTMGFKGFNS